MPALIIGANLPDVDAACFFWLDGVEHLGFRRGITHGPIAWVLLPLVLAGVLWWFDRWQAKRGTGRFRRPEGRLPVHFGWLFALSFIACLTHPALDWLNVYGIRLLEPFSSKWFYGDTLFIIDIWLWLGMGFATWFSLRREKRGGNWRKPARTGIAAMLGYIALNGFITANDERRLFSAPTGADVIISSPIPIFFPDRELISGSDGLFAINGNALPGVPLSNCNLDTIKADDPQVAAFLFWSRAPFIEPGEDGKYRLRDARYYDPLARDRFTVELPDLACEPL